MNTYKIKALGIAPYDSMKQKMEEIAENFPQLDIDVYVGDLKEGVDIVLQNTSNNYDVVISRGGTAEMIGEAASIPVIEISLSVYDILRAIKLAENFSDKYAIVGFPSITKSAHLICDLLQYNIEIVTIYNQAEAEQTLQNLKENGCKMILCDMVANTTAKKLGLNSILFISGNESIENAFTQAIKLCANYACIREKMSLLEEMSQNSPVQLLLFDEAQNLHFSSLEKESDTILEMFRNEVPKALTQENTKYFRSFNNSLFSVQSRNIKKAQHTYVVFYISDTGVPMASSKYGIRFLNKKEAEQEFYNDFYSLSVPDLRSRIEKAGGANFPIMLLGEEGTEKDQAAQLLYIQSHFQDNPFIMIDCGLINDKNWNYLTNHYNSPLTDNSNTLYFKDLDLLSSSKSKQLLSLIIDMNLCRRNRVLFSCSTNISGETPPCASEFVHRLSCLTLTLPALKEILSEIPAFSSLYLGKLNLELSQQIIGFEAKAMELLQTYPWPGNFMQFKKVIRELAVVATSPYISTENTKKLLKKEAPVSFDSTEPLFDINRTLEEITCDIIRQVFYANKENQSAAAKQLGISRTTLWRYLKK